MYRHLIHIQWIIILTLFMLWFSSVLPCSINRRCNVDFHFHVIHNESCHNDTYTNKCMIYLSRGLKMQIPSKISASSDVFLIHLTNSLTILTTHGLKPTATCIYLTKQNPQSLRNRLQRNHQEVCTCCTVFQVLFSNGDKMHQRIVKSDIMSLALCIVISRKVYF